MRESELHELMVISKRLKADLVEELVQAHVAAIAAGQTPQQRALGIGVDPARYRKLFAQASYNELVILRDRLRARLAAAREPGVVLTASGAQPGPIDPLGHTPDLVSDAPALYASGTAAGRPRSQRAAEEPGVSQVSRPASLREWRIHPDALGLPRHGQRR